MSRVVKAEARAGGFQTRYFDAAPSGRSRGTIVLLHDGAYGGDAETSWLHMMGTLSEEYRVVAPDMLGYGGSDKVVYLGESSYGFRISHLAAFCDRVGIGSEGAHFAGVSFGGSLLLRSLAATTPLLPARSVVSIAGTGGPWRSAESAALADYDGTEANMRRLVELMVDIEMPGIDELIQKRHLNTLTPGHVEACLAGRLRGPARPESADPPWPQALRGSRVPVMLIEGTRDTLMEAGWSEHFRGILSNLRIEVIDGKHLPNVDQPHLITQLMLEHITNVDAGIDDQSATAHPNEMAGK